MGSPTALIPKSFQKRLDMIISESPWNPSKSQDQRCNLSEPNNLFHKSDTQYNLYMIFSACEGME